MARNSKKKRNSGQKNHVKKKSLKVNLQNNDGKLIKNYAFKKKKNEK